MPGPPNHSQSGVDSLHKVDRETLKDIIRQVLSESLDSRDKKLLEHIDEQHDELRKAVLTGFPDQDPHGHKSYHEEQIEYMKDRRALWKDIRSKSISGVVWLLLVLIATAFWNHIKLLIAGIPPGPTP